jgi:hypothetical protein
LQASADAGRTGELNLLNKVKLTWDCQQLLQVQIERAGNQLLGYLAWRRLISGNLGSGR